MMKSSGFHLLRDVLDAIQLLAWLPVTFYQLKTDDVDNLQVRICTECFYHELFAPGA